MNIDFSQYRTSPEILKFVLTKCGGMNFDYYKNKLRLLPPSDDSTNYMSIDMTYIYYADQIISQRFKTCRIENLEIYHTDEIKNSYLFKEMKHLREFNCTGNHLRELPELPDTLQVLFCSNNQLTELPEIPDSVKYLSCGNNNIEYFPQRLEKIHQVRGEGNPGWKDAYFLHGHNY